MIAVRILVPYASDLTQLDMRVRTLTGSLLVRRRVGIVSRLAYLSCALLREILAGQKEHLLVEAAYDRYFWLSLLLLLL